MSELHGIAAHDLPVQYQDTAKERILTQELVYMDADGIRKAEAADERVDGIPRLVHSGGGMRPDETSDQPYRYDDGDDIQYVTLQHGGNYKVRTPEDDGTNPAANVSHGEVVGLAAVGAAEHEGRIVQEGYTDNGGTTYGRDSTGDFVALGVAHIQPDVNDAGARNVNAYDESVEFIHRTDL